MNQKIDSFKTLQFQIDFPIYNPSNQTIITPSSTFSSFSQPTPPPIIMKNLSGKTLIFYTFQQHKHLEYNVIPYHPPQNQPILIKDVLEQLPIELSDGRYHFRFKSEFFQGNEKIAGWIDINNLMAKVPLVAGSVYVKILRVKSNAHNKLFNLEKLARVGLGQGGNNSGFVNDRVKEGKETKEIKEVKSVQNPKVITAKSPRREETRLPVSPMTPSSQPQVINPKAPVQKGPQSNSKISCTFSAHISTEINLMQESPGTSTTKKPTTQPPKVPLSSSPLHSSNPSINSTSFPTTANKGQDLFQFQQAPKAFKNQQTTEQKLAFMRQTYAAQQEEKQNQLIARDQLQEKLKKWGYSGAKTINNLTTLLSTLHDIWPEWPAISLTELLKPEKLAEYTKTALVKTHPDKNRKKAFREKYLAKRVFELINQAKKAAAAVNNQGG